jgi:DNA-directed RNA polymerase subunit K/omega
MPAKTQDINKLLDMSDNLYEAVMVMAKRARQINEEFYQKKRDHQILEELEGGFEEEFLHTEPDEIEIREPAENEDNPVTHSQDEFLEGRLNFHYETLKR